MRSGTSVMGRSYQIFDACGRAVEPRFHRRHMISSTPACEGRSPAYRSGRSSGGTSRIRAASALASGVPGAMARWSSTFSDFRMLRQRMPPTIVPSAVPSIVSNLGPGIWMTRCDGCAGVGRGQVRGAWTGKTNCHVAAERHFGAGTLRPPEAPPADEPSHRIREALAVVAEFTQWARAVRAAIHAHDG